MTRIILCFILLVFNLATLNASEETFEEVEEEFLCNGNYCEFHNVSSTLEFNELLMNLTNQTDGDSQELAEVTEISFVTSVMQTIPTALFESFLGVQRFSAVNVQLEEIHLSDFNSAQQLNYLDLSGNFIKHLDFMSFANMSQLRIVDLSDNQIASIVFDGTETTKPEIDELKLLNLENNELKAFNPSSLKIENLNLNNNHLEELIITSEMLNVSAMNNKILSVKCDQNAIIEVLRLSENRITIEVLLELKHATKLKVLDLSKTMLTDLRVDSFTEMNFLEELNLAGTRLTKIPFGLFLKQKNLKVLNIANNNMEFIDCRCLRQLTSLTTLDISENNLMILKNCANIKRNSPNLTAIALQGNSWTCTYLEKLLSMVFLLEIDVIDSSRKVKVLDDRDIAEASDMAEEFFGMFTKYFGLSYKSLFNDSDLKKAFFVALKGNFEGEISRILFKQRHTHAERLRRSREVYDKIWAILISQEENRSCDINKSCSMNVKIDCAADEKH